MIMTFVLYWFLFSVFGLIIFNIMVRIEAEKVSTKEYIQITLFLLAFGPIGFAISVWATIATIMDHLPDDDDVRVTFRNLFSKKGK